MIIIDNYNLIKGEALEIPWEMFVTKIIPLCSNMLNGDWDNFIFLEIGSLHGNDTKFVKDNYPNSRCIAVEGLKENYEKYLLDKRKYNIEVYNKCIASYNGTITFFKKNILESGIHGIYNRGDKYGTDKNIVECNTLETFCTKNNIKKCDVMKIDVEGATFDILSTSLDVLKNTKVIHIETEDYPFFEGQKLDEDVSSILIENNWECILKTGYNPQIEGKQYDSVWINKNFLK